MKCFNYFAFIFLANLVFASGIRKGLHPAVNVCKFDVATISDCYCKNFQHMIPILKDGAPEMAIPALDPIAVKNVVLDVSESIQLAAVLSNAVLYGLSNSKVVDCNLQIVSTGMLVNITLYMPLIEVKSSYNMTGNLGMFKLATLGDCHVEFTGVTIKTIWTAKKYMKNGKVHLKFKADYKEIKPEKINIKFDKLSTDSVINESMQDAIADNIEVLFTAFLPIIKDILTSISSHIINDLYSTFPLDVLHPPN